MDRFGYRLKASNEATLKQQKRYILGGGKMKDLYFTLTGCNHYLGTDFLEKGLTLKLKKEPENQYDHEAIMVKLKGVGKCGYVANSPYTVIGETMSAGRLYDKIGKKAKAKVEYIVPGGAICKVICETKESDIEVTVDSDEEED